MCLDESTIMMCCVKVPLFGEWLSHEIWIESDVKESDVALPSGHDHY